MNKMADAYLNDGRASTVTLDENGVELNKDGSEIMRVGWNEVALVRSFKESTCFIAKNVTGLVIAVTNTYKDDKTFISTVLDGGMNINAVREMVGHADERTSMNSYCYDRHTKDERKEILEKALKA